MDEFFIDESPRQADNSKYFIDEEPQDTGSFFDKVATSSKPTFMGRFGENLYNDASAAGDILKGGVYKTGGLGGGLIQAGEENLGTGTNFGSDTVEKAKNLIRELHDKYSEGSAGQQAFDIGSSVAPALGAVAMAPVAGPYAAGATLFNLGAQTFGQEYPDLREKGADVGRADLGAGIDTATSTMANAYGRIPLLLSKAGILGKTIGIGGLNSALSFVQTPLNDAVKRWETGETTSPEELKNQITQGVEQGLITAPLFAGAGHFAESMGSKPAKGNTVQDFEQRFQQLPDIPAPDQLALPPEQALQSAEVPPIPDKGNLSLGEDLSSLPAARVEPDKLANISSPPEPKGILLEAPSSARTDEEHAYMQELGKPPLFGANGEPLTPAAAPPAQEVVKPFTSKGDIRQSLPPVEQALARELSRPSPIQEAARRPVSREVVRDPTASGKSFPDVSKEITKAATAHTEDQAAKQAIIAEAQQLPKLSPKQLFVKENSKPWLDDSETLAYLQKHVSAGKVDQLVNMETPKDITRNFGGTGLDLITQKWSSLPGDLNLLLVKDNGKGIGSSNSFQVFGKLRVKDGALEHIAVSPEYQNQGVGKKLLSYAKNQIETPIRLQDNRVQPNAAAAYFDTIHNSSNEAVKPEAKATSYESRYKDLPKPGTKAWVKTFNEAVQNPNFNLSKPTSELVNPGLPDKEWSNLMKARMLIEAQTDNPAPKGKNIKGQRGSISFKPAGPQDMFSRDGINKIMEDLKGEPFKERGFSKGERIAAGIVDAPKILGGRDSYVVKKALNQYFTHPQTLADADPGYNIAYEAAQATNRNIHTVAEGVGKYFEPYYNASESTRKKVVDALYGLEKATRNGKAAEATPETLTAVGLNPEEVKVAMGIRKGFDTALDTAEQAATIRATEEIKLKAKSIDDQQKQIDLLSSIPVKINEIKKTFDDLRKTNYMPHTRFGDYFTQATLNDGSPYFALHENKKAMNLDEQRLRASGATKGTKGLLGLAKSDIPNLPPDLALQFGRLDPALENIGQGFQKHFQQSKDIAGYDKNFDRVAADYVTSLARWSAKQVATPEYAKAFDSLHSRGMNASNSELYRSLQRYVDYQTNPPAEYNKAKTFLANYYLGMNVKSAMVNLTQTLTTTWPELYKHVGVTGAPGVMGRAYADAVRYGTNPEAFVKSKPLLGEAIKQAITDGSISEQAYRDLTGRARGSALQKYLGQSTLTDKAMWMFDKAEKFNRLSTFAAGFEVAGRKGLVGDAAQKFAERFVLDTQFDYSKAGKPEFARGGLKSLASTFRLFNYNYIRLMANNMSSGNFKAGAGQMVHMIGLAGLTGFPLAKLIVQGLQAYGADPIKKLRSVFGSSSIADSLLYGAPHAAGVNIAGSVGVGDIAPDFEAGVLPGLTRFFAGVGIDPFQRIGKAAMYHGLGQDYRAAEAVMPEAARYLMRAGRVGGITVDPKVAGLRNPQMIPLMSGTTPLDYKHIKMGDVAKYAIGLNPSTFVDAYEEQQTKDIVKKEAQDNNNINQLIAEKLYEGDPKGARQIRIDNAKRNQSQPVYGRISPDEDTIKKYLMEMRTGDTIKSVPKKARSTIKGIGESYR